MKKLFSLLAGLVLTTAAAVADISVTFHIDDVSRVQILQRDADYSYQPVSNLVSGDNVLTLTDDYPILQVQTSNTAEYGLASIAYTKADGSTGAPYVYNGSATLSLDASYQGARFTIRSFAYADVRTATCHITIDDPAKVNIMRGNVALTLEAGDNAVPFIPYGGDLEAESFTIRGNATTLYQVTHNDRVLTASYGTYSVSPIDGDRITIQANYPDVDVPLRLVPTDEASRGFITSVTVDGTPVANYTADDFTVPYGSTVVLYGNTADYKFVYGRLNNDNPLSYWYSSYSFFVGTTDPYTFTYTAEPYATFDITVHVDHPDNIILYRGPYYNNDIVALQPGDNTVRMSSNAASIAFQKANSACVVESFKDANGTEYSHTPLTAIPVSEGDAFTITTSSFERNQQALFYIDSPDLSAYGGNITMVTSGNRWTVYDFKGTGAPAIQPGYNTIAFNQDMDRSLQISFWGPEPTAIHLYHNGTKQDPSTTYSLTIADGDIIKAYLAAEPETFAVTFATDENAPAAAFDNVLRDQIVPVADLNAPLSVLTDTEISFSLTGTSVVTANGTALTPDDQGRYTLRINANTTLLAGGTSTAIDRVDAALNTHVYTLQGVLLIRDATPAQINALPAGLYIIHGRTTCLLGR